MQGISLAKALDAFHGSLDEPIMGELTEEQLERMRNNRVALENQAAIQALMGYTRMETR